ncbi:hypothetical protein LTR28_008667, partial [Elasticomyces elasticus]
MATMFHLRGRKRVLGPDELTPTSPLAPSNPPRPYSPAEQTKTQAQPQPSTPQRFPPRVSSEHDLPPTTPVSPLPPVLPPIPRIAAKGSPGSSRGSPVMMEGFDAGFAEQIAKDLSKTRVEEKENGREREREREREKERDREKEKEKEKEKEREREREKQSEREKQREKGGTPDGVRTQNKRGLEYATKDLREGNQTVSSPAKAQQGRADVNGVQPRSRAQTAPSATSPQQPKATTPSPISYQQYKKQLDESPTDTRQPNGSSTSSNAPTKQNTRGGGTFSSIAYTVPYSSTTASAPPS